VATQVFCYQSKHYPVAHQEYRTVAAGKEDQMLGGFVSAMSTERVRLGTGGIPEEPGYAKYRQPDRDW
jgi:hypothetical protein